MPRLEQGAWLKYQDMQYFTGAAFKNNQYFQTVMISVFLSSVPTISSSCLFLTWQSRQVSSLKTPRLRKQLMTCLKSLLIINEDPSEILQSFPMLQTQSPYNAPITCTLWPGLLLSSLTSLAPYPKRASVPVVPSFHSVLHSVTHCLTIFEHFLIFPSFKEASPNNIFDTTRSSFPWHADSIYCVYFVVFFLCTTYHFIK